MWKDELTYEGPDLTMTGYPGAGSIVLEAGGERVSVSRSHFEALVLMVKRMRYGYGRRYEDDAEGGT